MFCRGKPAKIFLSPHKLGALSMDELKEFVRDLLYRANQRFGHKDCVYEDFDHKDFGHKDFDHKDIDHKDFDHKDFGHKDFDHKDFDHKDCDNEDIDHKDLDYKEFDDKDCMFISIFTTFSRITLSVNLVNEGSHNFPIVATINKRFIPDVKFQMDDKIRAIELENIIDKRLEELDPRPDIHILLKEYDKRYFNGILHRNNVEVLWSEQLKVNVGITYPEHM